jgi:hypothetical protein
MPAKKRRKKLKMNRAAALRHYVKTGLVPSGYTMTMQGLTAKKRA